MATTDEIYEYGRTSAGANPGVGNAADPITKVLNPLIGMAMGSGYQREENINKWSDFERQAYANEKNAIWNLQNITKPVFQMEDEEWDRRFNAQNEWNNVKAQLERFMAAGGNPNNFFESGQAATPAGNPSVNEAASSFAQPADLARFQANEIESKAKQAYSFLTNMQAIKQSIDNLTEFDFRAKELKAMGIQMSLNENLSKQSEAERTVMLADMYGLSTKGQNLLAQTASLQQTIKESVERSKLLIEQQKIAHEQYLNTITEGDILTIQKEYLPFEKYFALESTRSQFIKNMMDAKYSYAQARWTYEAINTEVQKQALLGAQKTGQDFTNDILWFQGAQLSDEYATIWPKILAYKNNQLTVDTKLYGKEKNWGYINSVLSGTLDRGISLLQVGNQYLNTAVDAWAVSQSRGMSKALNPTITFGTPGYNTPVYKGGTYNPYGQ